ncbi:MAG: TetR/AcrR family transcriptional regulator [Oscillospiraceae bacterium]|nr:TetR/AcrR family transcriptional regulator [Oscillospiraceae bacterium]
MEFTLLNTLDKDLPTKQKILICALDQFCSKGYIETTIRDIASAVGITSGSIYGHFSSKEELLNYMLNDYAEYTKSLFKSLDIEPILQKDPTGEGVSKCIMLSISILTENVYYGNLVHLIHQEQHRNDLFGGFVLLRLQDTKDFVERVFDVLKEMKVIRADAESEYWGVISYSVLHLIPTCQAISIRRNVPSYSIKDMGTIFRDLFDSVINTYKL